MTRTEHNRCRLYAYSERTQWLTFGRGNFQQRKINDISLDEILGFCPPGRWIALPGLPADIRTTTIRPTTFREKQKLKALLFPVRNLRNVRVQVRPSPEYPSLQTQRYDPAVLTHSALSLQGPVFPAPSIVRHSSTSVIHNGQRKDTVVYCLCFQIN